MTLRGLHVYVLTAAGEALLPHAALIKTMDHGPDWRSLKAEHGIKFLLGRVHLDDVANLSPTPEAAAERLWGLMWPKIAPHQGVYDAIETPWSERFVKGGELIGHARACRRFCDLAEDYGFAVAVGNFNVGTPEPWELAEHFALALEHPSARFLSAHEYWLSWRFDWGFWAGRWKEFMAALPEDLRKPVIISECGIDGGLEEPPRPRARAGWRAYGLSEADYLAQLTTYMDSLDERVLGVCVFNSGDMGGKKPADRWDSFEVAGPGFAAWLANGPRAWRPLPPGDPLPPLAGVGEEEKPVRLITDFGQVTYPTWRELAPWPYEWNQLNDWSVDADGDQGRANNCGPQSVAAALHHLGMGEWGGDVIREVVAAFFGGSQADYLQVDHLVKFLGRFAGIECDTYQGDGNTPLRPVVEESITLGYPLIVLFAWDYDQFHATGHFMPVVGYDESGVYCHQVWGGGRIFMTWDEFEAWQKYGTAFRLRRRRSSQVSRY